LLNPPPPPSICHVCLAAITADTNFVEWSVQFAVNAGLQSSHATSFADPRMCLQGGGWACGPPLRLPPHRQPLACEAADGPGVAGAPVLRARPGGARALRALDPAARFPAGRTYATPFDWGTFCASRDPVTGVCMCEVSQSVNPRTANGDALPPVRPPRLLSPTSYHSLLLPSQQAKGLFRTPSGLRKLPLCLASPPPLPPTHKPHAKTLIMD